MRDVRAAASLLALTWRTDRAGTLLSATLGVLGALASVSYTLGFRIVIDGVAAADRTQTLLGAVLIAVLFTGAWTAGVVGASRTSTLTDRLELALGQRVGRLVAAVPGIAHLEAGEQLDAIDALRRGRRTLAALPRQLLSGLQVGLRTSGIVVLLATVYPPVLVVPALALAPWWAGRRAARVMRTADAALAEDRRRLEDLFALATSPDAAAELRTGGALPGLIAAHATLGERVRGAGVRAGVRAAAWEAAGWLLFALGVLGAILALVLRAAHGHVSPGGVVMAVSLMRRAQRQIARGTDTAGGIAGGLALARHLRTLETGAAPAPAGRAVPARLQSGIRLDDVGFRYAHGAEPVLAGVNLELPAGATVALLGPNGAGKSTLVKLLTGLYAPTEGRILVDGTDLAGLDLPAWRARTAATFQDHLRLQLPLGDAVGVGDLPRREDTGAVRAALAGAGGAALEERVPGGLGGQLGKHLGGTDLSGGQWQRVALARGRMRAAPLLLILDEPSASLDPEAEDALFTRYVEAAQGVGVTVLVSHRLSAAPTADLVVLLDGGGVREVGTHAELIARGGEYAELFALQARPYR